jgi:parvulin-like peptidyl-prolyl isomerase
MQRIISFFGLLTWLIMAPAAALTAAEQLPVVNGREVVATVNEEPITMEELTETLAAMPVHGAAPEEVKKAEKIDYLAPLNRLINTRLILLEAKNIGLDELPIFHQRVEEFSRQGMGQLLLEKETAQLRPDEKEVERLYREEVKEYQLLSVKLADEKTATALADQIRAGQDFAAVAGQAVAAGTAQGSAAPEYFKQREMLPQVAAALQQMKIGEVSPVLAIPGGFALMKLLAIRHPEEPAARERITTMLLKQRKEEAKKRYIEKLVQQYVQIDEELLKKVDFEAKEPGLTAMLEDKRPLAAIAGEEPVTVGELAGQLQKKFFHGVEQAIGKGKVNQQKAELLDKILTTRVLLKEARQQGIEQTEVFRRTVDEYRRSLLFGAFIEKVIIPDIRLGEEEISGYYQQHLADFSSPPMVRIRGIAFAARADAEQALQKLKTGTDFKWLADNAAGRVPADTPGLLAFDGKLLLVTSLPEDLQPVVTGAESGDFTLYGDSRGRFYVLAVEEVLAPVPQELEEVRDAVKEKLFKARLQQSLDEWTEKLKKFYPVTIYLKNPADTAQ